MKINAFKTLPILALLAVPLAAQTTPSPYNTPAPDDPNRMNPISAPENAAPPAEDSATTTTQDTQLNNTSTTTTTETTTTTTDTTSTDENALPQTAGPLGLLALLALGSAGSAFGLRKARRQ
jgi:hypothetical protein